MSRRNKEEVFFLLNFIAFTYTPHNNNNNTHRQDIIAVVYIYYLLCFFVCGIYAYEIYVEVITAVSQFKKKSLSRFESLFTQRERERESIYI